MKVLVTGGAGFIGSHLIRHWLTRRPADHIVNVDLLTYAGSRARLGDIERGPNYRFVQADITNPDAIARAMSGCELVIHCAAETHVDRSITNPTPFLRTNVEGTYVLLQAARTCGVARFLHISTDEVYGPVPSGAADERAPLAPRSPYAASKAAGDLLAQSFRETFGLPVTVLRPTNMFGPGQFPEKLIPLALTNAFDRLPVPVYGDGQQRRAWLFVADFCSAVDTALESGRAGEVYNVAGNTEMVNLETVRQVLKAAGCPESLIQFVEDRPGHDRRYAMDDAKLRQLDWRPTTSFEQGLTATVAWYRQHTDWWRPLVQTLREDPYHWLNRSARPGTHRPSGAIV